MKASEVITAARSRLGDISGDRWDDESLLLYTSLCQNDICIFTNYHRLNITIDINNQDLVYDIPKNVHKITRVEWQGKYLPIESRNKLDSLDSDIPCIIKDSLDFGKLEIYYGPNNPYEHLKAMYDTYGVVTTLDDEPIDVSDCTLRDLYGIVVEIDEPREGCELSDVYGLVTDTTDITTKVDEIVIYYTAVPELLTSLDEDLLLPNIWMAAFVHYISGSALTDDNDASNITRGEIEMKKYLRLIDKMHKTASMDFASSNKDRYITTMRRF